ncbi:MAG TPA: aldo/keto reductase [Trebonia sp.]|nr:aldo/keto reductase [Trebonia sp.]
MEYRQLGRSGLRISALTLGTMTFGGHGGFRAVGSTDVEGARRQVDMCLDAGVNLIDTADVYSGGVAEEITGEVIKGRRSSLLLSTKVRMAMGGGPNDTGLSRHHIIRGCEASLRRLGTEYIDIYHVHEWDGQTRLEETLSALDTLVAAGKVRYLGASNYAGWQLMKAVAVADDRGFEPFAAQQVYYSLEARDAEYELVPLAVDQGLGILVWSPLAGGLLSGKYRRHASPSEHTRQLSGEWHEPPVRDREKLYDTIEVIVEVASAHGATPAQVALAWLLGRPAVTSVIIGARTEEQLRENLGATALTLTADERVALDKVSAPALAYPYWHQLACARDRLGPADLALLSQHLQS